jgi:predicted nucleic acid-binding protein
VSSTGREHALVDANVLLRLFTGKPAAQARAARDLMARADAGDVVLHICPLVVAEVVWVLTSVYDQPAPAVCRVLTDFLASGGLVVEEGLQITVALRDMQRLGVDFVDGYIAARAGLGGMSVASFDKDFDRLGSVRLQPG